MHYQYLPHFSFLKSEEISKIFNFYRFGESKVELESLLTDEQLSNCPILILGNKIDRPGAAGEDELRQVFGLYGQTTGKGKVARSELHGRPLELFMCSVLKRQGYGEGFR